jgi:hypothetical protein
MYQSEYEAARSDQDIQEYHHFSQRGKVRTGSGDRVTFAIALLNLIPKFTTLFRASTLLITTTGVMPLIQALLVNAVDELELCAAAKIRDTTRLPRELIEVDRLLPHAAEVLKACVILSWRWDTDGEEPSCNLRAALRIAKDLKKRYLFIDIVSINQDLKNDDLIAAIMEYSDLYTYVQVIGAYEHEGARVNENMLRPWIVHEYSLLHKNPNSTVLVCHQNTKSFSTTEASPWTQRSLIRETLERQVAEGSDL